MQKVGGARVILSFIHTWYGVHCIMIMIQIAKVFYTAEQDAQHTSIYREHKLYFATI